MSAMHSGLFQSGNIIGGRYQIEKLLGQGGMSSVYKANDPNLRRTVAIKVIHPHLSNQPTFLGRFEREAAAVAQLRHPNIYQVHDFNHDNGIYYMVMEYVPGVTLEDRLKAFSNAQQRMTLSEALRIMASVCDAVDYAHQRNMMHRDLKPSNVMLNPQGEPILMDFGIARLVGEQNFTATGATIGTAAYMSPEQARGENPDHRTDIYSLGVMVYEMISGRRPFEGDSFLTVLMKHVNDPLPNIRDINQDVPAPLVSIIERALAKDPNQRYNSAAEMAHALRTVNLGTASLAAVPASSRPNRPATGSGEAPAATRLAPSTGSGQVAAVPSTTSTGSQEAPAVTKKRRLPIGLLIGGGVFLLIGIIAIAVAAYFAFFRDDGEDEIIALPSSANMAAIAAGTYTVGADASGDQYAGVQEVALEAFWIDRYEVTNAQYAEFLAENDAETPEKWSGDSFPDGEENHPVEGVMYADAVAYCEWVDKRLPTEAEWEAAARGLSANLYPWGDSLNEVTLPRSATYPVGTVSENQSPFGVYDMAGNVWEWVSQPYSPVPSGQQVLKGGQYGLVRDMAYRLISEPDVPAVFGTAGVRCAATEVEVVSGDDNTASAVGILYRDDFSDPESGWDSTEESTHFTGYHPPDYYHVEVFQTDGQALAPANQSFVDFTAEVDIFVDHTGTEEGDFRYGFAFRVTGDNYYVFAISPRSNEWYVFKNSAAGQEAIIAGEIEGLQGLDLVADTLRVDAQGSSFVLHINDTVVARVIDDSYAQGDIGFFVENFDESLAHVHFDDLTIREVDMGLDPSILLQDDFSDPATGWPAEENANAFIGYHPPDYYHIEVSNAEDKQLAFKGLEFTHVRIEGEVFVDHTDTEEGLFQYGLVARYDGDNYYAFTINPRNQSWTVFKHEADTVTVLAEGQESSIVGGIDSNLLVVEASGANFTFTINGNEVAAVTDASFASGDVGFYVETFDETLAHVHFDTLTIREIEGEDVAEVVPTEAPTATTEAAPTDVPEPTATPEPEIVAASDFNMVKVDAGSYTVGSNLTVELEEFWIDTYEVTNAQYADYLAETGGEAPTYWADNNIPTELGNHPVEGITFDEAAAYCATLDKRLPTEAEWEAAARGPQGWLYPWGDDPNAVNLPNSSTHPVGSILGNRSYFGAFDMAGNVWEWVTDPHTAVADGEQVLHGGANSFQNDLVFRATGDPNSPIMFTNAGIRCAASAVFAAEDTSTLLDETFANVESGWWQAAAPVDAYFYGYHPTDFYHMQVTEDEDCLSIDHDLPLTNFMAEVEIFVAATDTEESNFRYGLTIRKVDNDFYAFVVSPRTQTWQVLKSTADGLLLMDEGEVTTLSGASQEERDRLFVIAEGNEMSFFVNGELVSRVADSDYSEGNVGFMIETFDETYIHIHYDEITVWALPDASSVAAAADPLTSDSYDLNSPLCRGTVSSDNLLVNFVTHTVKVDETLSGIAQQYGITLEELLGANGRTIDNPSVIRVGQVLIIPVN